MGGKTGIVKGRIEEAVGALTGNDKLRRKGTVDQAVGQAKEAAAKSVGQAKQAARKVVGEAKLAARKAVNEAKDIARNAVDKATGAT